MYRRVLDDGVVSCCCCCCCRNGDGMNDFLVGEPRTAEDFDRVNGDELSEGVKPITPLAMRPTPTIREDESFMVGQVGVYN